MKNLAPVQGLCCEPFPHRRCQPPFLLDEVMAHCEYLETMVEIIAPLGEGSRLAREAAHALAEFTAKAINVIDGNLFS